MGNVRTIFILSCFGLGLGCGQVDTSSSSTSSSPNATDADLARSKAATPTTDGGQGARDDGGAPGESSQPTDLLAALVRMEDARRLSRLVVNQLLKSPDVVIRRRTLLALGRVGDEEAVGPLRTALTDEDEETRRVALVSLGQLRRPAHPDAEKVLRAFLELERRPQDQREAIYSLGRVGSREAAGSLMTALESPEPRIRAAAAKALGHMALRRQGPGVEAMVALASHLEDSDAGVRIASAFALSRCTDLTAASREPIGSALAKTLRRDREPEVRIMAGRALGNLDVGNVGYLIGALDNDDDWRVRAAAASSIANRGNENQRDRAVKIAWKRLAADPTRLTSADVQPLQALIGGIANRPSGKLKKTLRFVQFSSRKLLKTTTDRTARMALAHINCEAALAEDRAKGRPARVRRCGHADPPLITEGERKLLSVRALYGSTIPGALKRLKVLLRDPDDAVRLAAVEATGSHFTPLRLSLLERALLDANPHIVAAAAHKLSTVGPLYGTEVITPAQTLVVTDPSSGKLLQSHEQPETKGREPPTAALLKALNKVDAERDVETAINLLRAIGAVKATGAAPKVRNWAGHHNQSVRRAARKALEALGRDPGPEVQPDPPNLIDPAKIARLALSQPELIVETTRGPFTLKLRPDIAPATVANFLTLVTAGYYKNVRFHRVVPGFVTQTGDPTATSYGGPGHTIRCELNDASYRRGTVGMALAGPDTGGGQFFITYSAQPHLDRRYTIFGQITRGMELVDTLRPWDRILDIHPPH